MTETLVIKESLPVGSAGIKSTGWWGVWTLIATEGSLFGYLLLTYFYLYFQTDMPWPPEGKPKLLMSGINTIILLSSSVFVWRSERAIRRNASVWWQCSLMAIAIALGTTFIKIQLGEWERKPYGLTTNLYG